jgi:hypothetical protein
MSIGIGFDDDYSTALAEYKSRNGMSVKEMYGALNNHDRLVECLKKEREKYDVLIKRINDACWKIACIKPIIGNWLADLILQRTGWNLNTGQRVLRKLWTF